MDSFISLAWLGSACILATLVWRLFVAVDMQRSLEATLIKRESDMDRERQELGALMESQTETITALTQENATLHHQVEQAQFALRQLNSDHQALQEKYVELEHSLLEKLAHEKSLSEKLQTHAIEQSKLQRQLETFQTEKVSWEQAHQTLTLQHQQTTDKNQLYQKAVEAAKAKIDSLERDKKQLQKDLQQALYQIVALEQDQQRTTGEHYSGATTASHSSTLDSAEPSLPMFG